MHIHVSHFIHLYGYPEDCFKINPTTKFGEATIKCLVCGYYL